MLPFWDWQSANYVYLRKKTCTFYNSDSFATLKQQLQYCAHVWRFLYRKTYEIFYLILQIWLSSMILYGSPGPNKPSLLFSQYTHPHTSFLFSSHRIFDIVYVTLRCYYTKKAYVIVYLKPHILKYFNIQVLCKIHFLPHISLKTYDKITYEQ